jgi:hypothetical protein
MSEDDDRLFRDMGHLGGVDLNDLTLFQLMYLRAWKKLNDPPIKRAKEHRKWD